MNLIDIYRREDAWWVPLQLLAERDPSVNISHKKMPSLGEHRAFVESRPYLHWMLIEHEGEPAGCVYLTYRREIGVGILKSHQRKGLAEAAIAEMLRMFPGRTLANINPENAPSLALFRKLGFAGPIQVTLEHTTGSVSVPKTRVLTAPDTTGSV